MVTAYIIWALFIALVILRLVPYVPAVYRTVRDLTPLSRWSPAKALAQDEEDAHTAACLAALTTTDVAVLQALGWEPPADIAKGVEYERNLQIRNENYRRAVEAKQKREAAALMPYVPMTAEEMEAYKRRPLAERQAEADEGAALVPVHRLINPPLSSSGATYADTFVGTTRIDGHLHRVYRQPDGTVIARV